MTSMAEASSAAKQLTPYKLSLLVLLVTIGAFSAEQPSYPGLLAFLVQQLLEAQDVFEPTLAEFVGSFDQQLDAELSRNDLDVLKTAYLERLLQINSLDALNDMFTRLQILLGPSPDDDMVVVEKQSVYGLAIRRYRIAWDQMHFDATGRLFAVYRQYVEKGVKDIDYGVQGKPTINIDAYLEKHLADVEELRGIDLADMLRDLKTILEPKPDMEPRNLFYALVIAMKERNYEQAVESLHRLFDYYLVRDDHALYQYSLLYLAIIHYDFDCCSEAVLAVNESIAVAREALDDVCLGYALQWLPKIISKKKTAAAAAATDKEWSSSLANIDSLLESGATREALTLLQGTLKTEPSELIQMDCLVRISAVDMKAPSKLKALGPILKSLSTADPEHAISLFAKLQLAELMLKNGLATIALRDVQAIRPKIMTCGSVHVEASSLFLLARCQLAVGIDKAKVLRLLNVAAQRFQETGDHTSLRDVAYLQARIHHDLGDRDARNKAAQLFRQLSV